MAAVNAELCVDTRRRPLCERALTFSLVLVSVS